MAVCRVGVKVLGLGKSLMGLDVGCLVLEDRGSHDLSRDRGTLSFADVEDCNLYRVRHAAAYRVVSVRLNDHNPESLTTIHAVTGRIASESALLEPLRSSHLVWRRYLLLLLVLGGWNQAWSSLTRWIRHDASE